MKSTLLIGILFLALIAPSFQKERNHRRSQSEIDHNYGKLLGRSVDEDYTTNALYFQQILDHFNPEDNRTFTQKFYMNDTYWTNPEGPIFFEINGEAPCSGIPSNQLQNYAQYFGAMIVTLEHRFYGESCPFETQTYENLQYLTTKQALEDIAYFLVYLRNTYLPSNSTAPIVTFGCSYAGALSAWFRLKYPHLTVGTISSSGVVNAILDFSQFDVQVATSVGPQCAKQLRAVTTILEDKLNASPASNNLTKSQFLAEGFSDGDFYWLTADAAAESVQYGYQNLVCSSLDGLSGDALYNAYLNFSLNFYYPVFLQGDVYSYSTIHLQDESQQNGDRTWWWQECSELGYFQTAPATGSIRSAQVNLDYHRERCNTAFGHNTWPDTEGTNRHYGGADLQSFNIFFLQSSQDPWQWAGITEAPNYLEAAQIVVCEDCGHCSDLRGCPSLPGLNVLEGCTNQQNVDQVRKEIYAYLTYLLSAESSKKPTPFL